MNADKALQLVQSAFYAKQLLPYDEKSITAVIQTISELNEECEVGIAKDREEGRLQEDSVKAKWLANYQLIQRNKRCLIAYLYNRMEKMETIAQQVTEVSDSIKSNFSEKECQYYDNYNSLLSDYLDKMSDYYGSNIGANLLDTKYMTNRMIRIKVITDKDISNVALSDGSTLTLRSNNIYNIKMFDVLHLIQSGKVEPM